MVFLIQNTQNRDTMALQLKLSELIIAMKGAENRIATVEELPEDELEQLHKELCVHAEAAGDALESRRSSNASRREICVTAPGLAPHGGRQDEAQAHRDRQRRKRTREWRPRRSRPRCRRFRRPHRRLHGRGCRHWRQIVDGLAEAGEIGLDVVEHFAAGVAGETFDLLGKLQHVLTQVLQVFLQALDVDLMCRWCLSAP